MGTCYRKAGSTCTINIVKKTLGLPVFDDLRHGISSSTLVVQKGGRNGWLVGMMSCPGRSCRGCWRCWRSRTRTSTASYQQRILSFWNDDPLVESKNIITIHNLLIKRKYQTNKYNQ